MKNQPMQFGAPPDDMIAKLAAMLPGSVPDTDPQQDITFEVQEDDGEDGPMSDLELMAIIEHHKIKARSFVQDEISDRAAKANDYYLAQAEGDFMAPQTKGRAAYVDSSVADTINWLLPPLMEVFTSAEDVVEFCPRQPKFCGEAEQTTAMVNHVFKVQNNGYAITRTWIHDALMAPMGIIKVQWEQDTVTKTTEYKGITDLQFALIAQDPSLVVLKHRLYQDPNAKRAAMAQSLQNGQAQPPAMRPPMPMAAPVGQPPQGMPPAPPQGGPAPQMPPQGAQPQPAAPQGQGAWGPMSMNPPPSGMLHDVLVAEPAKGGSIKVVNVPLEEFYVSPTSRCIDDGYSAHVVKKTISDLRVMGFDEDVVDAVSQTEDDPSLTQTAMARVRLQGTYSDFGQQDSDSDPAGRYVYVVESFLKVDYRQTGIQEWRKVMTVGDVILENLPCDGPPFVILVSNPLPHLMAGVSVAEQAMNAQLYMTSIMRATIDNIRLSANGRMWAVKDEVEMGDLLDSRPGGIVRVKTAQSVGPLTASSGDVASSSGLMQQLDTAKQERTGVMKLTQGSDADILNATASGNEAMTDRSNQRIKLMARHFAETGFSELFLKIQSLLAQHQDDPIWAQMGGKMVECDPRSANNQFDLRTVVGLGTGDKTKRIQQLQMILQLQQTAVQSGSGLSTPQLCLNTLNDLCKAAGESDPTQYFQAPPPVQPQQPPQDPKILEIQAQSQKDMAQLEAQAKLDQLKAQYKAETDKMQNDQENSRMVAKMQLENELAREKMYAEIALQREIAMLQYGVPVQAEQAAFNSTYGSTVETVSQDDLLKAIAASPEPYGGTPQLGLQQQAQPSQVQPQAPQQ